jgi:Zn-dependent metalloprotease
MRSVVRLALGIGALVPVIVLAACSHDDDAAAPSSPSSAMEKRLEDETGTPWKVDIDPATGTPDAVLAVDAIAPSAVNGTSYDDAARAFLEQHKDMWRLTNVATQLALQEVIVSGDGTAHVRFVQTEGGLPVDARFLAVHFRDDASIGMINGGISPDASKAALSPTLASDQAVAKAEGVVGADYPGYQRAWLDAAPSATLLLRPDPNGAGASLAWRVTLSGAVANGAPQAFVRVVDVDAKSGAAEGGWDMVEDATGTSVGLLGDKKTFEIDRPLAVLDNFYVLRQEGTWLHTEIATSDYNGGSPTLFNSWDPNAWEVGSPVGKGAAVDGHRYASDVDLFYRSRFGWRSFDGNGTALDVWVHDNTMVNNAYFDSKHTLHFSDGNKYMGGQNLPLTAAYDVVAHEFTHGVTQFTSGLQYRAQSGALNESLSDIFGTFAENDNNAPAKDLQHFGSGFAPGGMRDFAHPTTKAQPDHMSNLVQNGVTPAKNNDWGGVHGNSGISNNAFWLMTFGGTNDTSKIPVNNPMGLDASRTIWWSMERYYLGATSNFDLLARWQSMRAWMTKSHPEAVTCAWVATGVITHKWAKETLGITCYCDLGDGGVQDPAKCADAGAPADGGGAPANAKGDDAKPDFYDSCKGRADGVYCSQLASYSSIVCKGGSIVSGQQCANKAKCIGPNGAGATVQCEGQPAMPAGADAGAPQVDGCAGRPDGVYCSVATPWSAWVCKGGSIAGGQQCTSGKTCIGPNGPGDTIACK